MIPEKFYQSVKSTIDYIGHQITQEIDAAYPTWGIQKATLDATTGVTEVLTSTDPAIVWSLYEFSEAPVDPLYNLTFLIGPKTTEDVSGEVMAVLMGVVQKHLPTRGRFRVKNYSGPTESEDPGETGWAFVAKSQIQEQVFDNQAAMRMIAIAVKVSRDLP